MERAASPHLRNSSFTSTRRYSTGMTPYHSLGGSNHSQTKRRLEFDDCDNELDDGPHPLPSSSATLAPPVRAAARAAQIAAGTYSSSVFQRPPSSPSSSSSWSHRHLDSHVLDSSNRSDHARHSRLLDFSNHSHKTAASNSSGGRLASALAPPGRRVDSGDDERLEAPTRSFFGRGDAGGASSVCGGESTAYGGSDDKSLATIASMRSRSVMSRQHSLLSLDNLSFSTELHVLMQRQASQSSLCSFASHAMHKRRNSWGSTTCGGASVAGESTVPPYLLRLTSASSALDGKGGAGGGASVASLADTLRHAHDDGSTGSWLQHVTSIRHDTTMMSHLRQERQLAGHLPHRPTNPITADSFWLQQMSSRSLSSFTTITTTTTTRTTTNSTTPPLPATLSLKSPSMSIKGLSKTPYPSPEDDVLAPIGGPFRGTSDGTSANVQDPHHPRAIPRKPGSSLRYSPEQPPYYQSRRAESATKSSIRSLRFSDEASTIVECASASSQPAPLSAPQQQQQQQPQYQPPLPLQQVSQDGPSLLHQERLSPPPGSETMELDEAGSQ
jgi:hypothetical protein